MNPWYPFCEGFDDHDSPRCDNRRMMQENPGTEGHLDRVLTTPRSLSLQAECSENADYLDQKIVEASDIASLSEACLQTLQGERAYQCMELESSHNDGYFDTAFVVGEVSLDIQAKVCEGVNCCLAAEAAGALHDVLPGEYKTEFTICLKIENQSDVVFLKDIEVNMGIHDFAWAHTIELLHPEETVDIEITKADITSGDFENQLYVLPDVLDQVFTARIHALPSDGLGFDLCHLPQEIHTVDAKVKMAFSDEISVESKMASDFTLTDCADLNDITIIPDPEKAWNDDWNEELTTAFEAMVSYCYKIQNHGNSYLRVEIFDDDLGFYQNLNADLSPGEIIFVAASVHANTCNLKNDVLIKATPVTGEGEIVPEGRQKLIRTDHSDRHVADPSPAIGVENKVSLGWDSGTNCQNKEGLQDEVKGPSGTEVTYCITITNKGLGYLSNFEVTNTVLGYSETHTEILGPDEELSIPVERSIGTGQLENIVTVSGQAATVTGTVINSCSPFEVSESDNSKVTEE